MDKFIGIDISKQTFDVSFSKKDQQVFKNTRKGFERFLKQVNDNTGLVMEASGPYCLSLANFMYDKGFKVYVVNPLKIKRFSQMNFNRAKTDKKDAEVIRGYALKMQEDLKGWKPESRQIKEMKQLHTALELLNKQLTQVRNQLGAFKDSGSICKELKTSYQSILKKLEKEKDKLESKMLKIGKEEYQQTLKSLTSIPGIGNKTAIMLIAMTSDFDKFEHYKELIAYVGFSPRIYQSGTSINGKGHICKMGKAQIRKLLYMCSWTAKKYNKGCVEMYERLKKKGKPERVIKIALANKLLKQAFAIAKNKTMFNENYQSKVCF